jgi:hypothetical protein
MKYLCLVYCDEKLHSTPDFPEDGECLSYLEALRKNGQLIAAEPLQSVQTVMTLRVRNDRVSVTDGPFAETKEQLGGILVLEAKDLNNAIQLMSKHPGVRLGGCFENRPTEDIGLPDVLSEKDAQLVTKKDSS